MDFSTGRRERLPRPCPRLSLSVVVLPLALAAACATSPERKETPRRAHAPYRLAPQAFPAPESDNIAAPTAMNAPPQPPAPAAAPPPKTDAPPSLEALDLETALEVFASTQNAARNRATGERPAMAAESLRRWSEIFGAVDRALRTPARELPLLTFVRARVALESELELDATRYAALPPWLPIALEARLQGLTRKIDEHRALLSAPRPRPITFRWPLESPLVTSLFGPRRDPFTGQKRFHRGVDLRARTRQRVEAIAPGTVTRAAENGGYGLSVEILHEGGFTSTYSHLSLILVRQNDRVEAGDPIGLTGNTGRSTAAHLHFEIWKGSEPVDPLDLLPAPEILRSARR